MSGPCVLSSHCFVCTLGLMWCDKAVLVCKCFELPWWKLWSSVWDHCLWYIILTKDLLHDINCGIGCAPNSPDDWKSAVVVNNQEAVRRFKSKKSVSIFSPGHCGTSCGIRISLGCSWKRSGIPCSSVLYVGWLLSSLARIQTHWNLAESSQHWSPVV